MDHEVSRKNIIGQVGDDLPFRGNNRLAEAVDKGHEDGEFSITLTNEDAFILLAPSFGPCDCDDPDCPNKNDEKENVSGSSNLIHGVTPNESYKMVSSLLGNLKENYPKLALMSLMEHMMEEMEN